MDTLTEQDYLRLKDLYEGAHGRSLVKIGRAEDLLGGYFTGASTLFDLLGHTNWGSNGPKTLTELSGALRLPPYNNGVDNACDILRKARQVLFEEPDQLPKWAAIEESPLWRANDELNLEGFARLASFQKPLYKMSSVPDYAILARWRLSLGI